MTQFNVCGVLVMTRAENINAVTRALSELEGVDVHAHSPDGKLIVTVESSDSKDCIRTIETFNTISGVASTSLIYQHAEELSPTQELTP